MSILAQLSQSGYLRIGSLLALSLAFCATGNRAARKGLYLPFLSVVMLWFRFPSLFLPEQNVDESQAIAGAMTLLRDPVFWRSVDGTTHGPLAYYALTVPAWVGFPIDYFSSRLIGLGLSIASVILAYGTIRNLFSDAIARVAILPMVAVISGLSQACLIQYSSCDLPAFVCSLAAYFYSTILASKPGEERNWAGSLGLVLGCVPFAKLQAVPEGLAIGILMLVVLRGRPFWRKSLGWFVGGMLVVPAIFAAQILISGGAADFWQSYLLNNLAYANRANSLGFLDKAGQLLRLSDGLYTIGNPEPTILLRFAVIGIAGALVYGVLSCLRPGFRRAPEIAAFAVILLATGFSAIWPGNAYPHYFLLLLYPLMTFVGIELATFMERRVTARWARGVSLFLAAYLLLAFHQGVAIRLREALERQGGPRSEVAKAVLRLAKPQDRMAIWGWSPKYFVETGLAQGTREGIAERQITEGPQRAYYRQRYLGDLKARRPRIFLDTTGPADFKYRDRSAQGHEAAPGISEYIEANYEIVSEIDGVRIYRRRN